MSAVGGHGGLGLLVLLAGCFADPSSGSSGGGDTGSTGAASTSSGVVSSSTSGSTNSTDPATTAALDSSSTSGEMGSSSTDGESSPSTGPNPTCPDGQVSVGALCLTPLTVEGVLNASQPDAPGPFGEMCQRAVCSDGFALGGGFELDGVRATASFRDEDETGWTSCGAPNPELVDNLWRTAARCVVGEGDIVVSTETYALSGDEGPNCFVASCPPGLTLVGGGGRWPRFTFQTSEPSDDASSWVVCGQGAGEQTEVEVDAHCAVLPRGREMSVFEETQPVPAGESGCAQVSCDGGIALAGGVATSVTMIPRASYPDGDRWTACGFAEANLNVQVRSRVLCLE